MASGGLYSFRPELGETPETLKRRREVAEALLSRGLGQPATTIGGGLAALGQAIGGGLALRRLDRTEAAHQAGAADTFSRLFGGGAAAPETAEIPSTEPVSTGGTAAVADALAGTSAPVATVDLSGDKAAFVAALMPAAIEASKVTGVDPRIIVAQAAQETGWGRHAPGNNYFGIKSHGQGGGQTFTTHEVINGKRVKIQDSFRRFGSPGESVAGYAQFLRENPRYKAFMAAQGLDAQLAALGESGYATDPNYAASVGAIARSLPLAARETAALPGTGPVAGSGAEEVAAALAGTPGPGAGLSSPSTLAPDDLGTSDPAYRKMLEERAMSGITVPQTPGAVPLPAATGPTPAELPGTEPVSAPPVVAARPRGIDPLPQTSGLMGAVARAGHESLSPGAQAVTAALAGGAGTDALAGGGGGLLKRLFAGGGGGGPPAVAAAPGGATAAPAAPGAGGLSLQAQDALAVIADPWADDTMKATARFILEQELQQADPKYQLELEKLRRDVNAPPDTQIVGNLVVEKSTGKVVGTIPSPGFRPATAEEAAKYGSVAGQFDLSTGEFKPINPPSGTSLTVGPDGTVTMVQGPGVKGGGLTEGQSKDTVYATRAEGALPTIDKYETALTSPTDRAFEAVPLGVARGLQSDEFQLGYNAGQEFLQAILRKDSQGAITPAETTEYGNVYLPQIGDSAALIAQKRVARHRALEALKAGMPPAALLAQGKAILASTPPSSTSPASDTGGRPGPYREGATATDPATGRKAVFRNGQWVVVGGSSTTQGQRDAAADRLREGFQ